MTDLPPTSLPPMRRWLKPAIFLLTVAAVVLLTVQYSEEFSLKNLAQRETALRRSIADNPWPVYGGAFLLYVLLTGLSLPGAVPLSMAYGWFFGFWPAVVIVSFGSSIGATIAFLLSRFLFRDFVQRLFGDRLERFNAALQRDGALYLFTLRLIPGVPYLVVNTVMGLTPMKLWTFYWVSQLGMLAGTMVFVYAGSTVGSLEEIEEKGVTGLIHPQTVIAFVLLAVFSIVVNWLFKRMQRRRAAKE